MSLKNQMVRLKAGVAAIHWHSGKFSVRHWNVVPKSHLAATLRAIHDETAKILPVAEEVAEEVASLPLSQDCHFHSFPQD